MNHLAPIANRAGDGRFKLPPDGWFLLAPKGEHPHPDSGLVQVIDDRAVEAMASSLPQGEERLCDYEHFSHDPEKSTEAAGWIDGLRAGPEGLFAHARWTDGGESALSGGRYRFISPVWNRSDCETVGKGRVRPLKLSDAGLTNCPNLLGLLSFPLSNRRGVAAGNPTLANATTDTPEDSPTTTMNRIAQLLGLADGASEDQIIAAVRALMEKAGQVDPLSNRITALTTNLDTLLLEAIAAELDGHGIKEEATRNTLIPVLKPMKNRAERADFLKLIGTSGKEKPNPTPLTNRSNARTPGDGGDALSGDADKEKAERRARKISNRAAELNKDGKMGLPAAYRRATQEIGED